jgi:hypothetical protein
MTLLEIVYGRFLREIVKKGRTIRQENSRRSFLHVKIKDGVSPMALASSAENDTVFLLLFISSSRNVKCLLSSRKINSSFGLKSLS